MDEQEILAVLRAHVARAQSNGNQQPAESAPVHAPRVDISKLEQLSAELLRLRGRVGQLNPRNAGVVNRAAQAFKKAVQRSLSWYTRSLHEYEDGVNQNIEYHARAIASLQQQVLQLGGGLPEVLQETLRTAQRATQEQLAPYAQLFRGMGPVLDLGCGRGEFLELLKEEGVAGYGVDSDRLACDEARKKALKAVNADVIEHLSAVADKSLGGIFSSRLVEYLTAHQQIELVRSCAKKLRNGGLLIIETTNPDSDFPFGRTMHIDPTQLRAIYPEILKSMVESAGFEECRICVLAPQQVLVAAASAHAAPAENSFDETVPAMKLSRAPAYAAVARRS
jgi:SAM-dependent methyltransferase